MRIVLIAALSLLISVKGLAQDAPGCASSIKALRSLVEDPGFPLRWSEVSMDDGKPLVISIVEHPGALGLAFFKSGDGLWAEGSGVICKVGARLEARLPKDQLRVSTAASWILRLALADGGNFTLQRRAGNYLVVATQGWSGRFIADTGD